MGCMFRVGGGGVLECCGVGSSVWCGNQESRAGQ